MGKQTNFMQIGSKVIGAGHPVLVQSMLNKPWDNTKANLKQAKALENIGCDILRVAIPTLESVALISALKEHVSMPIVADIHFDWKLAIASLEAGADKIRINPGNIGDKDKIKAVATACNAKNIPIRIGVNSGSVEKHILEKYGSPTAEAMAESALYHAALLEQFDFTNIALSVKSSHVPTMIAAYKILAEETTYPLHLGVTHAGTAQIGLLKSAAGIGGLLAQGIGDTIRVSLTGSPESEIKAGRDILTAVGLGTGLEIISCPACGRADVDVESLTKQVEEALQNHQDLPLTVAVMGCVVNGPGEAREADLGITGGGQGRCALFAKEEVLATGNQQEMIARLEEEVNTMAREGRV